jgi:hypothetical protein
MFSSSPLTEHHVLLGGTMGTLAAKVKVIRIELSPEQTNQPRTSTGRDIRVIELTVEELEQSIAPRLATNHNETMLMA